MLKSIKIEKINKRVPEGWNFTAYSVMSENRWYNLKGRSEKFYESMKEGQMLDGVVTQKPYTSKDGESKISYTLNLVDDVTALILSKIEDLSDRVLVLEGANLGAPDDIEPDEEIIDY